MSSATEVVDAMLKAVLAGDAAGVFACIDPDIVVIEPASLAYGGVFHGLVDFRDKVFGAIMGKMSTKIGRCEMIGADGKVAASMDITFTSHKTGNKLIMPYVEIYTVRDGKIVHLDVYPQDTKRLSEFWEAN